jgi:hypothetical protein
MAGNEKLTLLNRAGHAPKLRDTVNGSTADGFVLTWDATNKGWYPSDAGSGGSSAPASAQYVTLATSTGLSNERVMTSGTGVTITDGGAGENVTISLTNNSVTITAGNGLAGGGSAALGGSTTLSVSVDNTTVEISGGQVVVKDAGITPAKLAFQPRKDNFVGNGSATVFTLTTRILDSSWLDGVVVARNGQLLKQVVEPQDLGEYSIADVDNATRITLGGALPLNDQLFALYWA